MGIYLSHALAVILRDALRERQSVRPAAELFGIFRGIGREDEVHIRHTEVGFQQGIDYQRVQLVAEACKARTAYAAQQQSGLPAELNQYPDGQYPRNIHPLFAVTLLQIIDYNAEVADEEYQRHVAVVRAGRALDDYRRRVGGEGLRQQRAAEPSAEDQQRPLEQVLVL